MRERLTDRETQRRLLEAARALVVERGVSTGLEHIPFEDVIRASGVSRSSAYRRWPNRERFYAQVLLELARGTSLPHATPLMIGPAIEIVRTHSDPHKHRDLVVELLRGTLDMDFTTMRDSPEWRTFLTLIASYTGIIDEQLRGQVAAELARVERQAVDARARAYAQFTSAVGYRLVRPLSGPTGFDLMSVTTGATMFGMLTKGDVHSAAATKPRKLRAFGSTKAAEWHPATYATAALVLSFIEPDPGVEWTAGRIDDLVETIQAFSES